MCTVSIIRTSVPDDAGAGQPILRLVANRDERRDRPRAVPPVRVQGTRTRAVMPVDPAGGGTWVAATDAGLVFVLLNGAETAPRAARTAGDPPSRGRIIQLLTDSLSMAEVREQLAALDWRAFRPWRLLVTDATAILDASPSPGGLRLEVGPVPATFVTTSSSLHPVETARRRTDLFDRIVDAPDPVRQDAFHAHRWPDRPEMSVVMARADAQTVSRTVVERFSDHMRLTYTPLEQGEPSASPATSVLAFPPSPLDVG
jgi:hypothetical protein